MFPNSKDTNEYLDKLLQTGRLDKIAYTILKNTLPTEKRDEIEDDGESIMDTLKKIIELGKEMNKEYL